MLDLLPLYFFRIYFIQVSHCYPTDLAFFPQQLVSTLETYGTVLEPDIRSVSFAFLAFIFNKSFYVNIVNGNGMFFFRKCVYVSL